VAQSETERSCLVRLVEMEQRLSRMSGELPPDARPLGQRAHDEVQLWQSRLAQGSVDLEALSSAMREISALMEALAARLVLAPWTPRGRARPS